ncbi:hypothetical protein Tco_1258977 [Tanacetum coccineum]
MPRVYTSFWKDLWIGDNLLKLSFPRLFALEENKDISVADKMNTSISSSFRCHVRGGVESQQLDQLSLLLDTVILSNMDDRWFWDLNGDGVFQVKDVRSILDEAFRTESKRDENIIKIIPSNGIISLGEIDFKNHGLLLFKFAPS